MAVRLMTFIRFGCVEPSCNEACSDQCACATNPDDGPDNACDYSSEWDARPIK